MACEKGYLDIVQKLIEAKADINLCDQVLLLTFCHTYNYYEAKFILSNSVPAAHADSCMCIIPLHFNNIAPYFVVGLLPFAS